MISAPNTTMTPEQCGTDPCNLDAIRIMTSAVHEIRETLQCVAEGSLVAGAMHNHPGKTPVEAATIEAARIKRECDELKRFSDHFLDGIKAFQKANSPKYSAAAKRLFELMNQVESLKAKQKWGMSDLSVKRKKLEELGLPAPEIDRLAPMADATAEIDAELARTMDEITRIEAYLKTYAAGPLPFEVA